MAARSEDSPWQDFDLVMAASAYAAEAHRGGTPLTAFPGLT